jgi:hypothetical protein
MGWYGDLWYGGGQGIYGQMLANIYLATMRKDDLQRCLDRSMMKGLAGFVAQYEVGYELDWIRYLAGKNPEYVETALDDTIKNLNANIDNLEKEVTAGQQKERNNAGPVGWCGPLLHLMMGSVVPKWNGQPLLARFRYFDPEKQKQGISADCAALVEKMDDKSATLVLVNTSQTAEHTVIVQTGAYAEHQCVSVEPEGKSATKVNGTAFAVKLAPGAGQRFVVFTKRYANAPTLKMPCGK